MTMASATLPRYMKLHLLLRGENIYCNDGKVFLWHLLLLIVFANFFKIRHVRSVFRTQSNIYDGAFLWKYLTAKCSFYF